jgi:hypothetical protein
VAGCLTSRRRVLVGLWALAACGGARGEPPQAPPARSRAPARLRAVDPGAWIEPLPPATPASWRTLRPEPAQSLDDYRAMGPNVPRPGRDRVVLQPLGQFPFDVIAHDDLVMLVRAPELALVA